MNDERNKLLKKVAIRTIIVLFGSLGMYYIYRKLLKKNQNQNNKTIIKEKELFQILMKLNETVVHNLMIGYDLLKEDYDYETEKFNRQDHKLDNLSAIGFKKGCKKIYFIL